MVVEAAYVGVQTVLLAQPGYRDTFSQERGFSQGIVQEMSAYV